MKDIGGRGGDVEATSRVGVEGVIRGFREG